MPSDDPSQVDTATLLASMKRDMFEAQRRLREAFTWLGQAQVTALELENRQKEGKL